MKKKNSVLLLSALFLGGALSAQQTKNLTLEEAVNLGISNSKNLKIDAAKIETATANYIEAKNRRLPDLKISANALALTNAHVELKAMPSSGGGVKANSAFLGNASFSLPLFAGGRIKYGIKSAEYLVEASKLSAENDKIAVAYNVSEAYNNLFKAQQAITVLQENLKVSQERDKNFLNLENNGVIARNDRLKAALQTSNIELQLLDAQNNFDIANINMDLLLGLEDGTQILVDEGYISENLNQQGAQFFVNEAFKNRKDIQALEQQRKAAEFGTRASKAENLPTIALTAGYVAAEVPNVLTITNAGNIGVGIQYNIANLWKKNSSLMQSQAREKELLATNDLLNDQINLQVNRDFKYSEVAKRKIEVYEKNAEQANENYRITKNKYDNGLSTMQELLDADAAQISANINVINAKADAALAYKKLQQTAGILH